MNDLANLQKLEAELLAYDTAAHRERCNSDFPYYAASCLRIRVKEGAVIPFNLNEVQRKIHDRLEQQLKETGRIRAVILKARQPGCSTYVEGRFYWKISRREGVRGFILTHHNDATSNLFNMTMRFHENCPEDQKPITGKSNVKELSFLQTPDGKKLDSGYRVGTAEGNSVGRSDTIQYFHGSEVARWATAAEHITGAIQAVPSLPNTEIILESTANGSAGVFYNYCKQAQDGTNEFILIFLPWFWTAEYAEVPPSDWKVPDEFAEYGKMYELSDSQVYWAWKKNAEFAAATADDTDKICWRFRQEYPANAQEAFQTQGGGDHLIDPLLINKARKAKIEVEDSQPIFFGVDVARGGKDRTRIIDRQGRRLGMRVNIVMHTRDTMEIVGRVKKEFNELKAAGRAPSKIYVDVTGVGAGVVDRLKEDGYPVEGVNFGATESLLEPESYFNKRAEMFGFLAKWFKNPAGVQIADDDTLASHLAIPVFGEGASKYDGKSRLQLESKEHMRKRAGVSPDGADAAALTFAGGEVLNDGKRRESMDAIYERVGRSMGISGAELQRRRMGAIL